MPGEDLPSVPGGVAAKTCVSWDQVTGVYRRSGITYLYVGDHAYLLPHSQAREGAGPLWDMMKRCLPAGKLHDLNPS